MYTICAEINKCKLDLYSLSLADFVKNDKKTDDCLIWSIVCLRKFQLICDHDYAIISAEYSS